MTCVNSKYAKGEGKAERSENAFRTCSQTKQYWIHRRQSYTYMHTKRRLMRKRTCLGSNSAAKACKPRKNELVHIGKTRKRAFNFVDNAKYYGPECVKWTILGSHHTATHSKDSIFSLSSKSKKNNG